MDCILSHLYDPLAYLCICHTNLEVAWPRKRNGMSTAIRKLSLLVLTILHKEKTSACMILLQMVVTELMLTNLTIHKLFATRADLHRTVYTHAKVKLHDSILKTIESSSQQELKESKDLILRIRRRDLYQMTGVGAVLMTPLIGNLSDRYGRKALLTLPLTVSVIPLVILAYSRDAHFFYAYYVAKTFAAMVEGCVHCLALAYVADKVSDVQRASSFGILAGVGSASFVGGTLAARFLSTALTFQVAAVLSMIAAVYMRIFLKESVPGERQPLLKEGGELCENNSSPRTTGPLKRLPSVGDLLCLLKSSPTFSQAAVVLFFNSLADGGLMISLLYYLKARFQFNKNQFSDLLLISGIGATLTQLLFMPLLLPAVGEEKLVSTGLLVSCLSIFIYSISWSPWIPYALAGCSIFGVFVRPSICSIASKQVGPTEQGMVQGCLSGISSFANIISPFIFSPLTALFLSENAPFYFPGFSLMCLGLALVIAFIQSLMIRADSSKAGVKISSNPCRDALV